MRSEHALPYVVRWVDKEGEEGTSHVIAYSIDEAVMSAGIEVTGKGGAVDRYLSILPDLDALRTKSKEELDIVHAVQSLTPDREQ